jgi:hypothetical protein
VTETRARESECTYEWASRDKLVYFASLVPLVGALATAIYVLATAAVYLAVAYVVLYLAVNVFQAGCCVGCPYRGRYCPAVFGIYISNVISARLYKNRSYDARFFKLNETLAEIALLLVLALPVYWLVLEGWYYVLGFFGLVVLHGVLFFPTQCTRCSYHDICPGGRLTLRVLRRRRCSAWLRAR